MKKDISAEFLRSVLVYHPEIGIFTWKKRPIGHFINNRIANSWNAKFADKIAGGIRRDGYSTISINNSRYFSHRLAWLFMCGSWCENEIDHRDGNPQNNKWSNLRAAIHAQNMRNRKDSRSGMKGVTWSSSNNKWQARITVDKRVINLGYFSNPLLAKGAYTLAAENLHGKFCRQSQ